MFLLFSFFYENINCSFLVGEKNKNKSHQIIKWKVTTTTTTISAPDQGLFTPDIYIAETFVH